MDSWFGVECVIDPIHKAKLLSPPGSLHKWPKCRCWWAGIGYRWVASPCGGNLLGLGIETGHLKCSGVWPGSLWDTWGVPVRSIWVKVWAVVWVFVYPSMPETVFRRPRSIWTVLLSERRMPGTPLPSLHTAWPDTEYSKANLCVDMKWGCYGSLQISALFATMRLGLTLNTFMICRDTNNKNCVWSACFWTCSPPGGKWWRV